MRGSLELYLGGPGSVGAIAGVVETCDDQPAGNSIVMIVPCAKPLAESGCIPDRDNRSTWIVFGARPLLGEYTLLAFEDVDIGAFQNPELLSDFERSGIKGERGA